MCMHTEIALILWQYLLAFLKKKVCHDPVLHSRFLAHILMPEHFFCDFFL